MQYVLSIMTKDGWKLLDHTIRAPIKPLMTRKRIRQMFSVRTNWNPVLLAVLK